MAEAGRVLVVEDEETIREVLVIALEDEGYVVRAATHGREALELLATWRADLIVLDLMLPILDGWGFLAERRRQGLATDARVVIVSASRRALTDRWADADIAAVLPKPFDLEELIDTVDRELRAAGSPG